MKKIKLINAIITILEMITIVAMINKASSMIVTVQDWIEYMIAFTAILLDLLYTKLIKRRWEKWEITKIT